MEELNDLLFAEAELAFKKGSDAEKASDDELALKYYKQSATKFINLIKSEKNERKRDLMKEVADNALERAGLISKKTQESAKITAQTMRRLHTLELEKESAKTKSLVHLTDESWQLYERIGNASYAKLKDKKYMMTFCLNAYITAAENINSLIKDTKDTYVAAEKKVKLNDLIQFIEGLKKHLTENPDFKEANFLTKFPKNQQDIIVASGNIRGNEYPIWKESMGIINIYNKHMYTDPGGFLVLSDKQMKRFSKWERAQKIYNIGYDYKDKPFTIAYQINGYEVDQSMVGDCSVVSSLGVCAHFELKHKHNRRLVTSNIFPQDEYGNPIYNPTGKYVVRLFLNGVWRSVEIDDYFPINTHGGMICANSQKKQLWVPILEKAYLKVHGGYNFQGSISSTDLFAFTSWLPEKIPLKDYDLSKLWKRARDGYKNNDCLITIGTGDIKNEEEIGLKSNHAYGVFEIIETAGVKLLLVKNPWGNFRWNGRFSTSDSLNWTPELKKLCHLEDLAKYDNGIFWIDFQSVSEYFDYMDINWNPALLIYRQSIFDMWKVEEMMKDDFNLSHNPQYIINLKPSMTDTSSLIISWIIITKIITSSADKEQESDFIAMHVFNNKTRTKIRYNENPLRRSVYTNEQHYLLDLAIDRDKLAVNQDNILNLVLSQYKRKSDLSYNIQFLCSTEFTMTKASEEVGWSQKLNLILEESNSGGTPSSPYFFLNPQYLLKMDTKKCPAEKAIPCRISFSSPGNSEIYLKLYLLHTGNNRRIVHIEKEKVVAESDTLFRPEYCYIETALFNDRFYTLVLSNFDWKMLGTVQLKFECQYPIGIKQIPPEGHTMIPHSIIGEWNALLSGGSRGNGVYEKNPIFILHITKSTEVMARMREVEERRLSGTLVKDYNKFEYALHLGIYPLICQYPPALGTIKLAGLVNPILQTRQGNYSSNLSSLVTDKKELIPGNYAVIGSTFYSQQLGKFEVILYGSLPIEYMAYQS